MYVYLKFMYVYICMYIIHSVRTFVPFYIFSFRIFVCMYICMYVYVCDFNCSVEVPIYVYMYVSMYVCI